MQTRERQRRFREAHNSDNEWHAKRAAQQRARYHRKQLEWSMATDEITLLQGQNSRLKKRLSAVESKLVEEAVEESDESWDDEGDELDALEAADADTSEPSYADWSDEVLRENYEYARGRSKYAFRKRTALSAAQFDALWEQVEPHFLMTTFTGEPRLEKSAGDDKVAPKLQFYMLLYWLRTVSSAEHAPAPVVGARAPSNIGTEISYWLAFVWCSTRFTGRWRTHSNCR